MRSERDVEEQLMSSVRYMAVGLSAFALCATATSALALTPAAPAAGAPGGGLILAANDFTSPTYGFGPVTSSRTLEWDSRKGKWGLHLGVEQRTDRLSEYRDVQPGLYYKLTPRLHIGGAVSLAPAPQINQRLVDPQVAPPRVRLETTFKF